MTEILDTILCETGNLEISCKLLQSVLYLIL